MNAKILHDLVLSTPPNSKTRKRACMACKSLARFAGVTYDPSPYAGRYSPKSVKPREIPDDRLIREWWEKLSNPGWKWVYGMLATYGLRPHEAFRLDFDSLRDGDPICQVQEETKTGARMVWPFYPEWFDEFKLYEVVLPPIKLDRPNIRVGESATHYFSDFGLPFRLYAMRHRWAIRTLEYGLETGLAARQMGHSKEVHDRIYHKWIDQAVHQRAFEALMARSDRPKPP